MRTLRFLGSVFAAAFFVGVLSPSPSCAQATVDVWIDPGHGGPDKGNLGYDKVRVEKNIALQLSAHLYNSLGAIGYSSYFTRLSDYYPTLSDRAAMASGNLANINGDRGVCQLFISMHLDARDDPGKIGTTTYYPKFKLSERKKNSILISKQMGEIIHPKLMQNAALAFFGCNQDLHVLSRNFEVLRESTVPSILIESCILTNQCQQNKIAANGNQGIVMTCSPTRIQTQSASRRVECEARSS